MIGKMLLAVCGLVAMTAATAVHAATYFVDDDGVANCATATHVDCAHGCRTWAALVFQHAPTAGDHIKFCTGTYRETVTLSQDGSPGKPITLERASSSDVPAFKGTDLCTSWQSEGNGVYSCAFTPAMGTGCDNGVQKLFVDGAPIAEAQANGCPSPVTGLATLGYCSNWPVTDCTASSQCANQPDGTSGTCILSKWCWNAAAAGGPRAYLHLDGNLDPAAHVVEIGSRQAIVNVTNRSYYTLDGLTFVGGESWCTAREPFTVAAINAGPGVTITNCTWQYDGLTGLQLTGATSPVITNNVFEDQGTGWSYPPGTNQAVQAVIRTQANQTALTISGNTFRRLGSHTWSHDGGGTFVKNCGVSGGQNTAVCNAVMLSIQSPTGLVHIDDNVGDHVEDGIDLEPVQGAVFAAGSTIARNTLVGWPHNASRNAYSVRIDNLGIRCTNQSGGSVACSSLSPAPVFHEFVIERNSLLGGFRVGSRLNAGNLQAGDAFTVAFRNNIIKAGDRNFGNADAAALVIEGSTDGIQIFNNTLQCESVSAGGGSGAYISSNAAANFRNNILDFSGCSAKITDSSSVDSWNASDNIGDIANSGRCAAGANTISYVNKTGNPPDLHVLMPSSAVVDKGAVLQGITTDIDGQIRPQGAGVDIGADEVVAGAVPPPPLLISADPLP